MSRHRIATSCCLLIALSGCASIIDGSNQSLSVQTISAGNQVDAASCELDSNKGTWFVSTPGTVVIHRSYDPINVKCSKDGFQPAILAVKSSTKGMAYGNILLGGLVGTGVDMETGAAYDYPEMITVFMQAVPVATPLAIPPFPKTASN